ncbi:MAG TPA: DUF4136 domain-containing protein [Oceanipulchritudo sp.]|nr:DUF4136 domain-containing protein [Oceanipulchritudo sp.]
MKTATKLSLLLSSALLLLVGCESTPKISSEFNPETDFSAYKTYALMPLPTSIPGADPGMVLRTGQIVKDAVRAGLNSKGYIEVPMEEADFAVNMTGKVVPKVDVTDMGYTAMPSRGWYGYYTPYTYSRGVDVDQYEEGTVILEVYDSKNKEMVWVGWGVARREGGVPDPVKITNGINSILAKFPPSGTASPNK